MTVSVDHAIKRCRHDGWPACARLGHQEDPIVGAGVAGLAIAALLRRRGVPYTLLEQSSRFDAVGVGIQLSPNGVRILQRLGVGPVLAEHGVPATSIEIRRWDTGALLSAVPHGPDSIALYGAPYYLIHRADLQRGLVGLLPPGEARLARRVTAVTEHHDHVTLSFADGTSTEADVVIGADGVHSVVRAAVVRPGRRRRTPHPAVPVAGRPPGPGGRPRPGRLPQRRTGSAVRAGSLPGGTPPPDPETAE